MKIGIFDSGLGGLIITKAIRQVIPQYDYVYLGDTKRVPYGDRTHDVVYKFTCEGLDYLFEKENCGIVIIACNTASSRALRRIQKEYKNRKILGVLIPSAEEAVKFKKVGVLATIGTVNSKTFIKEIKKLKKDVEVFQNYAPMLVPLIEKGEKTTEPFLTEYLKPFLVHKIDALILGCTHYPILKNDIKKIVGKKVKLISQDEIVPKKLKKYFARHREITKNLSQKSSVKILFTKVTPSVKTLTKKWFGKKKVNLVNL